MKYYILIIAIVGGIAILFAGIERYSNLRLAAADRDRAVKVANEYAQIQKENQADIQATIAQIQANKKDIDSLESARNKRAELIGTIPPDGKGEIAKYDARFPEVEELVGDKRYSIPPAEPQGTLMCVPGCKYFKNTPSGETRCTPGCQIKLSQSY